MNKYMLISLSVLILLLTAVFSLFYSPQDVSVSGLSISGYREASDPFSTGELHWNHMPLSYNYNRECGNSFNGTIINDIENAVWYVEQKTNNSVYFVKTNSSSPDILFVCDFSSSIFRYTGFVTLAEAKPFVYENTTALAKGEVYIYSTYSCSGKRPTLVIHELLHLFGLGHSPDKDNIMNQYVRDNCNADISEEDINYLMGIYSKS